MQGSLPRAEKSRTKVFPIWGLDSEGVCSKYQLTGALFCVLPLPTEGSQSALSVVWVGREREKGAGVAWFAASSSDDNAVHLRVRCNSLHQIHQTQKSWNTTTSQEIERTHARTLRQQGRDATVIAAALLNKHTAYPAGDPISHGGVSHQYRGRDARRRPSSCKEVSTGGLGPAGERTRRNEQSYSAVAARVRD